MPHQITVTGKTGPDRTITAAVVQNVQKVDFDLNDKIISITTDQSSGGNIKEFDLGTITTVTFAISGGNYTIVAS